MNSNYIYNPFNLSKTDHYCVYITHYNGSNPNLPANYIGSTKIEKIYNENYIGSVSSKRYKKTFREERKFNFELFDIEIIYVCETQKEALYKELKLQRIFNVVKNGEFINECYSIPNGYYGRDVTRKNNPNYLNREIILMTPEGIIIEDQDECWKLIHKINLRTGALYNIARKIGKHHKGFQCRFKDNFFDFIPTSEIKIKKLNVTYSAMHPNGYIETGIESLSEFCKKHNIFNCHVYNCADENTTCMHISGFQFRYEDERFFDFIPIEKLLPTYCIMFPDGTIETKIRNVMEFARKHNINYSDLYQTAKKDSEKTHAKGFQLRKEDLNDFFPFLDPKTLKINGRDPTIYEFENKITGEIFIGIKSEFIKKYDLHSDCVSGLIFGHRKTHKNWFFKK